ncbi:MarC family protein [Pleomorphomonas koreensis]|uniref:MarC family protein n=1 Tax=Pleomorphomonas koreensis TaxID=257440 RepID=UPI000401192B|nr:MarC family protein [Pleomorphomonas koreensis]
MPIDYILNAFATLFVTIDPVGLAPLVLALTAGARPDMRRAVATRASVIAFLVLIAFAFTGAGILTFLGISMPAFRIAGGLLLFWIAFEMVFEKPKSGSGDKGAHADVAVGHPQAIGEDIRHLAVFPIAIPFLAGPGAISATILLSAQAHDPLTMAMLVLIIAAIIGLSFAIFIAADRIDRYLGDTGRNVLTRLLGVLLAALAVQFVADGIKAILA